MQRSLLHHSAGHHLYDTAPIRYACPVTAPDIVDLDDPATWSADLVGLIDKLAPAVPECLDTASDLHNEAGELAERDSTP